MRGLKPDFFNDLKNGLLSPLLDRVKKDHSLDLEIRENYINIYYRGGNILKISPNPKPNTYIPAFDENYESTSKTPLPPLLSKPGEVESLCALIPNLKQQMDFWFSKHHKDEREIQQQIVRENNRIKRSATSTDYFICDMEYANPPARLDLVAAHWPSSGTNRKNNRNIGLSFIEIKYADSALKKPSGIEKHIRDLKAFTKSPAWITNIKKEMKEIFNQKRALNLIEAKKDISSFSDQKPEYIFILANHDPDSSILKSVLSNIPSYYNEGYEQFDLKFASSNLMGYGLYENNVIKLSEFLKYYTRQIYTK